MKKTLLVMGGLVAAFLIGYVPQYLHIDRLSDELQQSTSRYESQLTEIGQQNRILLLQRDLGILLLEIEDQNYGMARERSTRWFDQLTEAIATSSEEQMRQALTRLSQRRDPLTAMLTEANPDAATQVRQMYLALTDVTATD